MIMQKAKALDLLLVTSAFMTITIFSTGQCGRTKTPWPAMATKVNDWSKKKEKKIQIFYISNE